MAGNDKALSAMPIDMTAEMVAMTADILRSMSVDEAHGAVDTAEAQAKFSVSWAIDDLNPAQPVRPNQMPHEAAGQQCEGARDDAGTDVEPLHGLSMPLGIALAKVNKGPKQADQRDWDQQVNQGVATHVR